MARTQEATMPVGFLNPAGEENCFLNAVLQSL